MTGRDETIRWRDADPAVFRGAILAAVEGLGVQPLAVEKDFRGKPEHDAEQCIACAACCAFSGCGLHCASSRRVAMISSMVEVCTHRT